MAGTNSDVYQVTVDYCQAHDSTDRTRLQNVLYELVIPREISNTSEGNNEHHQLCHTASSVKKNTIQCKPWSKAGRQAGL